MTKFRFTVMVMLVVCLLLSVSGMAKSYDKHSLKKGAWSMQFQVDDNFDFQSFENGMFSIKKHFSDKTALRLGFTANYRNAEQDRESTTYYPDTIRYDEQFAESDRSGFTVNLTYIHFGDVGKQIKMYYGLGPSLSYSKYETQSRDETRITKNETTGSTYGINAFLGGEWFVTKGFSLLFEYGVRGYYSDDENKRTDYQDGLIRNIQTTNANGYYLDGFDAKFGVAVYF